MPLRRGDHWQNELIQIAVCGIQPQRPQDIIELDRRSSIIIRFCFRSATHNLIKEDVKCQTVRSGEFHQEEQHSETQTARSNGDRRPTKILVLVDCKSVNDLLACHVTKLVLIRMTCDTCT